ncbi:MAG: DUF1566 domain-containing protein [Porphyromonadaceae bacterium]|nr:DUF1566 domain-containing protein [Porphyromonadaceae bacterium]MCD8287795.1 DUF1566 domain-containing protein [Porphyromonadaceae bacterium]
MKTKILFLGIFAVVSLTSYSDDKVMGKNLSTNAEEDIYPSPTVRNLNIHEYVDLGLSVVWATCNMGADSPADYGDYYAFGEIKTKSKYTSLNSRWYNVGVTEEKIKGTPKYDIVTAQWGGTWRLPTADEIDELVDKCTWEWATKENSKGKKVQGYEVTGPNSNSIFLPAAGYYYGASLYNDGSEGYYWSCSPDESNTNSAHCLYFFNSSFNGNSGLRYFGRSVRPVIE